MIGAWRIAIRNLGRNRRRNVATGVAIALGYAALVVLGGYANLSREGLGSLTVYLGHVGHVSIFKPGGLERSTAKPAEYAFSPDEQRTIAGLLAADPRIEVAGRYLRAGGLVGNGCQSLPFVGTAVERSVERRLLEHPRVLRWAEQRTVPVEGVRLTDARGDEPAVALSLGLSKKLRKHPVTGAAPSAAAPDCSRKGADGDPFVQLAAMDFDGGFNALDARVTTLYRAVLYDENKIALQTELETMQRLLATDRVTSFSVYLREPTDAAAVERDLAARLAAAGIAAELHRFDEKDVNPFYVGTLQMIGAIIGFTGLLVVAVAALSMLNAMTLTVLERTRELATFRSLGFTRGQVTALFLREAATLTAIGVAVGLLLGLAVTGALGAADVQVPGVGMAGTFRLLLIPSPSTCLVAAAAFFPLSLAATWLAVRRSVAQPVAHLLSAVTA